MANIDKKILTYTSDFVRYVDDIRIFFKKREDAIWALHELTYYLYTYHRLVFSGEKTKVRSTKFFLKSVRDEEKEETAAVMVKADKFAAKKLEELLAELPPYGSEFSYDEEYEKVLAEVIDAHQFELLSTTYLDLFKRSISRPVDFALLKHILRKASGYRVRNLSSISVSQFRNNAAAY